MSIARSTLCKARFFLAQAVAAESIAHASTDRMAFLANIEAAIVYGRSVTFHIQKEFNKDKDFAPWYANVQNRLRKNARDRFLLQERNFILKEGPTSIHRAVEVTIHSSIHMEASATMILVRGQPWYRRRPRILYEDFRRCLLNHFTEQRERKRKRMAAQQRQSEPAAANVSVQKFVFDDPKFNETPAQALLGEYLDELDAIVSDAESRFKS